MDENINKLSLEYHRLPPKGKLAVVATKSLANQHDLSLAYSPGVAAPCLAIEKNPHLVSEYTARGNLIAVISNGTAVLGLGAIGALASKPVMEGKAVLFKKFAGIDVFDLEVDETDIDKFVDAISILEPSFGGINLEDIKAPECFEIEKKLQERMKIPVFHDDQHGTAIIVSAATLNGLELMGKKIEKVKIVASGAGAAALACLNLLVDMGAKTENITVTDIDGVVYKGRSQMDPYKAIYAQETEKRTLGDALEGADVFLGLSAAGVLKPEILKKMSPKPLIFALANPVPEIMPEEAKKIFPEAIIATGRSDYPNQVNNVLCFPFLFRGALDVGATAINKEMKIACVKAIASLARKEVSDVVSDAYEHASFNFGSEYIIPTPFDPRLILEIAPAVAKAAMDSGVATRPIEDFSQYQQKLTEFVYRSGLVMRPVFNSAKKDVKRVVYAEGEELRVLQAVQIITDEGFAYPVLIGRRNVVKARIKKLGLRLEEGNHFELCDPEDDSRYRKYWQLYHDLMGRKGVTPVLARSAVRNNVTLIASLMLQRDEVDAMVCGVVGRYHDHLKEIRDVIGNAENTHHLVALTILALNSGPLFICDTHVGEIKTAGDIAEMTILAIDEMKRFGIEPKVALVSSSNFGSSHGAQKSNLREAVKMLHHMLPDVEIDGEMHADSALRPEIRKELLPNSRLKGVANLLIMPSLDAANITYNALKVLCEGQAIGPVLRGTAKPAHILTNSTSARGIVNVTALACVDAQNKNSA